jgi:hypothetical protein
MKKKAIISGLALLFGGFMLARAQDKVVQPSADAVEAKVVSVNAGSENFEYDTKLYASAEEAMLAEQSTNPAKPTPTDFDTKLVDEGSSANNKLRAPSRPETPESDPKLDSGIGQNITLEKAPDVNQSKSGNTSSGIDANTGLEKIKTEGTILNYREINGSPSQEIPAPQGKIINYRELKGPDDQPREKEPAR